MMMSRIPGRGVGKSIVNSVSAPFGPELLAILREKMHWSITSSNRRRIAAEVAANQPVATRKQMVRVK